MDYFIAPNGKADATGKQNDPWSFAKLMEYAPQPGDTIRLAAGATYSGALEWFYVGEPERPVTLSRYGDADKPNPVIASGQRRALWYGGLGGLTIEDVDVSGSGLNGIEVTNDLDGRPARNITLKGIKATGYALSGIMVSVSAPVSDILITGCNLSGNANGLFTSGANNGTNLIRKVRVVDTTATGNSLFNKDSRGNGVCLVGVDDLEVVGCEARRNGALDGQGHSGFTFQQCRRFRAAHCHGGETAPGPWGDGQDFVSNSSDEGVIEYCDSLNSFIGFSAHDDRELVGPAYPSRRIVFRHNSAVGSVVCYQVFRTEGDVHLHDNEGHTWAFGNAYAKVLDVWDAGGSVRYWHNAFRADGRALLLEAGGPTGLKNVRFSGDSWQWPEGQTGAFVVRGAPLATLAQALAVQPLELDDREVRRMEAKAPQARRIVCPKPERPKNVRRPAA